MESNQILGCCKNGLKILDFSIEKSVINLDSPQPVVCAFNFAANVSLTPLHRLLPLGRITLCYLLSTHDHG